MKKRYIPFLACTLLSVPAQAALIAYDGFDYAAGAVAGNNGGSGFAGAWTEDAPAFNVQTDGLTFTNLLVSGGRAEGSAPGDWVTAQAKRELSASISGQTFGSFLYRRDSVIDGTTVVALFVGGSGDGDNQAAFTAHTDEWGGPVGARLEGSGGSSSGAALTQGDTFLVLFSSDLSDGMQTLNLWALTEAQFDNFKPGGLNEMELGSAGVGSGSSDVWAKVTNAGSTNPLEDTNFLKLMAFSGGIGETIMANFDEVRIGGSLDDVTPLVPEPSAALLGGLGLLALLRRRR